MNTGDTILVSQHNPAMSDIAAAMSGSVSRDGYGGMRANLPMGGHRITGLAAGVDPSDAVTVQQISGSSGVPVGAVMDFAGSTAPTGWLVCAGQSLSRTDYADLFAAIGTTFGSSDGSSFSLPDCRGRVVAGMDVDSGGMAGRLTDDTMTPDGATAGAVGGGQDVTLTQAQIPAHTHTGTATSAGSHTHSLSRPANGVGGTDNANNPAWNVRTSTAYGNRSASTDAGGAHTHTLSITNTGGDEAHPNVQPTILMNKIIKATANG